MTGLDEMLNEPLFMQFILFCVSVGLVFVAQRH